MNGSTARGAAAGSPRGRRRAGWRAPFGVLLGVLGAGLAGIASAQAAGAAPAGSAGAAAGPEDPLAFVAFVTEPSALCVSRQAVRILVRNTHPTRSLRVWLDRSQRGGGTGDRSRSELAPGAEPEPLGCSRTLDGGDQAWRPVRAQFID